MPQPARRHYSTPVRLALLERAEENHAERLDRMETAMNQGLRKLDVLAARVGIYASIGAIGGGAIVVAVARVFFTG